MKSGEKMIVQACGSPSWGGLEIHALKTAGALRERGYRVTLLCAPRSALAEKAGQQSLPIQPLLVDKSGFIGSIVKINTFLRNNPVSVIHTHLSHDLGMLVPAIKLNRWRGRFFLTKQMVSSLNKKDLLHRFLYRRLDGIFAVSSPVRQNVIETCPVIPEHVHLLWNSIPIEAYHPDHYHKQAVREELHIDPQALVIGMVGRMTPKKGHKEFLQAARRVLDGSDKPLVFLVVGRASYQEESYEKEVRELAFEKLHLQDHLIFTGFRNDVPRIMRAMDILAFPSYKEAFGITVIEAMAMCVPVVASNSGGVPDIILDGKCGLLVPPRDEEALAKGLLKLIDSEDLRSRFAIAGRMRVEQYFRFDQYIEQLEQYYFG